METDKRLEIDVTPEMIEVAADILCRSESCRDIGPTTAEELAEKMLRSALETRRREMSSAAT